MSYSAGFHQRLPKRYLVATVTLALAVLPGAGLREVPDTGVFQGGPARTGYLANVTVPEQPLVLWKFQPPGYEVGTEMEVPDLGGVLVHRDTVYSSDRAGRLYALDVADGTIRWQYDIGEWARSEQPTVVGDIVYYATTVGVLALSRLDGNVVWRYEIPHGADETSPLVLDGVLFVCGYDGVVYALVAKTGELKWTRDIVEDAPPSSDGERARIGEKPARPRIAASDGDTLFQPVFDQSRLIAIDCETGTPRWSFQAGAWIYANPVVTQEYVLIGSQDKYFYCLKKESGEILWKFATKSRIEAGAAVDDNSVYFGSCDGTFYRLNLTTGEKQWSFQCDVDYKGLSPIYSAPLISDRLVCFGAMEGQAYALNTLDGSLKWKFRPSRESQIVGSLATDGNRLFLASRYDWDERGEQAIFAIGDTR